MTDTKEEKEDKNRYTITNVSTATEPMIFDKKIGQTLNILDVMCMILNFIEKQESKK